MDILSFIGLVATSTGTSLAAIYLTRKYGGRLGRAEVVPGEGRRPEPSPDTPMPHPLQDLHLILSGSKEGRMMTTYGDQKIVRRALRHVSDRQLPILGRQVHLAATKGPLSTVWCDLHHLKDMLREEKLRRTASAGNQQAGVLLRAALETSLAEERALIEAEGQENESNSAGDKK